MRRTYLGAAGRIFHLRTTALGVSAAGRGQPVAAPVVLRRRKGSLLADQRGAVAFEMLIVYSFMMFSLLFPAADLANAAFQFISAWGALRSFGQYLQYHPPADPANPSWSPALPTTVSGYAISPPTLTCGDTGAACAASNLVSPKYYSYSTTVTLAPLVLTSLLCTSGNANKCSFTLSYSERFQ
jgi:hypothetical protein